MILICFPEPSSQQAIPELMQIAEENGMSMTTLMLAWYNSKKFIGSTIIGKEL